MRSARSVPAAALVPALAIALLVILLAGCSDSGGGGRPGADAAQVDALDTPFTTFDGRTMRVSDLRGTPVVLNFFAEWCAPCVREMPEFQAVHRALGDAVAFIGLNSQDDPAKGRAIANRTGVTYTLGTDPDDRIFTAFDPIGMPITVLIRADGTVARVHQGELRGDRLTELIRTELGVP